MDARRKEVKRKSKGKTQKAKVKDSIPTNGPANETGIDDLCFNDSRKTGPLAATDKYPLCACFYFCLLRFGF